MGIVTPLKLETWKQNLKAHSDQDLASYIVRGIELGLPIGVNGSMQLVSAGRNMLSASQNPEVVEDYFQEEVSKGTLAGLLCWEAFVLSR